MGTRRSDPDHIGLGIDIGGTGIKCALVNLTDGSLASDRFRVDTPKPSVPGSVADAVAGVVANVDYAGPVGLAFPGVLRRSVVQTTANLDDSWNGRSLEDVIGPVLPGPAVTLNDADAAGLAEVRYGAGVGYSGLIIMVTLGTGIGTALIHDGVLVPNSELGHIEVDGHDAETRASAAARERRDMSWPKWGRKVGKYLRSIENVLWPDLFIIGGGASKRPDKWFDEVETRTPTVLASFKNNAGIVGAALAASDKHHR